MDNPVCMTRYNSLLKWIKSKTPDFSEYRYGIFIVDDLTYDGKIVRCYNEKDNVIAIMEERGLMLYDIEQKLEVMLPNENGKMLVTAYITKKI